jgi:VCBS repeat-containing protein
MENAAPGTQVGTLSAEDVDEEDTHTYALVAGEGDTDNGSFAISGNSLTTTKNFDFESKNSYSIRIQVMDESGETYVRQLPIQVSDDISDNQTTEGYRIPGSSIPDNPSPKPKGPDLFYCKGDGQPIRLDKYQNGTCDCPDGSDELPGTCK